MALPINWYYRGYAGRKMTLGIRPEHIALSSQAEGGVPLVMDTLEMWGRITWPMDAGANKRSLCVWRIRSARKQAVRSGCICQKIICTYLMVKQDNDYE